MMEDWSKHSAENKSREDENNQMKIQHTNSTNELAPRSKR